MKISSLLLGGALSFSVFPVKLAHAAGDGASRPADPGCVWKEHEFKELGIRLLFEDCKAANAHYELSVKGNWLEMHRTSDNVTYGGPSLIQVFSKPPDESIQDAIQKTFIDTMHLGDKKEEQEARKSCMVRPLKQSRINGDKQTFEIVPTGNYEKKILKDLQEEPRDYGCGSYGKDQKETYFEYHPHESKTKYAFVIFGQDEHPMFDENSIIFIEP